MPTLLRFYSGDMRYGISIPPKYREEMQRLLEEGPPAGEPPQWINWGVPDNGDEESAWPSSSDPESDYSDRALSPQMRNPRTTCRFSLYPLTQAGRSVVVGQRPT